MVMIYNRYPAYPPRISSTSTCCLSIHRHDMTLQSVKNNRNMTVFIHCNKVIDLVQHKKNKLLHLKSGF